MLKCWKGVFVLHAPRVISSTLENTSCDVSPLAVYSFFCSDSWKVVFKTSLFNQGKTKVSLLYLFSIGCTVLFHPIF